METLHAYIDVNSQILIVEYPGDEVQSTTKFQYKCKAWNFMTKSDVMYCLSE